MDNSTDDRITASELKAHCAEVLERVATTRQPVTITKHGRVVARIIPADATAPASLFGLTKGSITVHGDLLAPIDVEWEAGG